MAIQSEPLELAVPKSTESKMFVTPEMAVRWLERNNRNRPISTSTVERYRRDMAAGNWVYAADPIRFDVNGDLLDGQHRLHALGLLSDVRILFLVVRGLPTEAQLNMDQGRRRNPGQQLELLRIKNGKSIAAAAKLYILWRSGDLFRTAFSQVVSSPQIQEWVVDHSGLIDAANENHSLFNAPDAPPSVVEAAYFRFAEINKDSADQFFTLLASGAGLVDGHPILTLDKRLRRLRKDSTRMSQRDYLGLFILAWNAWHDNRNLTKFQKPRGGSWTASTFPEPK